MTDEKPQRRRGRPAKAPAPESVSRPARDDGAWADLEFEKADTLAEKAEKEIAWQALLRLRAGEIPSTPERRALRALEVKREKELRWRYYRSVPQADYVKLSGRPGTELQQFRDHYGIPTTGETIDLSIVIRGIHDLIGKYGQRIAEVDEKSQLDLRIKEINLREKEIKLAEREKEVVDREHLHQVAAQLMQLLRRLPERLEQKGLERAYKICREVLEDVERELVEHFMKDDGKPSRDTI